MKTVDGADSPVQMIEISSKMSENFFLAVKEKMHKLTKFETLLTLRELCSTNRDNKTEMSSRTKNL